MRKFGVLQVTKVSLQFNIVLSEIMPRRE
jgi:hypothetical protein